MISVYWYIFYGYNYSFDKHLNETCGRSRPFATFLRFVQNPFKLTTPFFKCPIMSDLHI